MKKSTKQKFPRSLISVAIAAALIVIAYIIVLAAWPKVEAPAPVVSHPVVATTPQKTHPTPPPVPAPKPVAKPAPAVHDAGPYSDADLQYLLDAINAKRADAGLAPLVHNAKLDASAQAKADAMVSLGFFAHNDPDGSAPWHYITDAGYAYTYAGENLSKDYDPEHAVDAWMNSPTHKANILNPHYRETGFAIEGPYIVEHFASPAP